MIFDGHSDILTDITVRRLKGENNVFRKYHLDSFKEAKIGGAIFVIWIDPPYDENPSDRAKQIVACMKDEIEESKDILNVVTKYEDLFNGEKENKVNMIIGMEGMSQIGEDLDLIDYYYHEVGVRHASLTWNEQNELATGVKGDDERGLTEVGKKAIQRLEDLGILVDVSHLNEKSFWDVMDVAKGPVIASHSNAKALCRAKRNLDDEQLKAIAKSGGLVGINAFKDFVADSEDDNNKTVKELVDHMEYIINLIGIEHMALGFDFNEYIDNASLVNVPLDLPSPNAKGLDYTRDAQNIIIELCKRGYSQNDIDMISYKNFYRLLEGILK